MSLGALLLIGTTCLGRDRSKADTSTTTNQSSVGGPAVGRTELTQAEWEREQMSKPAPDEAPRRTVTDSGEPSAGDGHRSNENP